MTTVETIGRCSLKKLRLTFAQGLFEATTGGSTEPDAKKKFNCGLLITPTDPQIVVIRKQMQAVAKEKWKDKAVEVYNSLKIADKLALHDGDAKPNYSGYPGMMYLSPATPEQTPPTLVITIDGQNCTVDTYKNDKVELVQFERLLRQKFYSGAYVNANIQFWAQDNKNGKRINCQLRGLQFHSEGDSFGGGGSAASSDEFDADVPSNDGNGADGFDDDIG